MRRSEGTSGFEALIMVSESSFSEENSCQWEDFVNEAALPLLSCSLL